MSSETIKCTYCGQTNHAGVAVCWRCGHPPDTPKPPPTPQARAERKFIVVSLAVFAASGVAALVAFVILAAHGGLESSAENNRTTIRATARAGLDGLTVTNNDKFACAEPEAIIHDGWGGYSARLPDIDPGETVTVSFFRFVNSDNERFDYLKKKPSMITMTCKVNGKVATVGWTF